MRIESILNKSVAVIGTFCDEFQTVADFRQFRVGEYVKHQNMIWFISSVDTMINPLVNCEAHNYMTLVKTEGDNVGYAVCELELLADNPRLAPANLFDALAHVLPVPMFVAGAWLQKRTLMGYLKNSQ